MWTSFLPVNKLVPITRHDTSADGSLVEEELDKVSFER